MATPGPFRAVIAIAVPATLLGAGCSGTGPGGSPDGAGPEIVVTTDILGDVVSNLAGDAASVDVVMPSGASPHDFQPSASQVAAMRSADVLVTNGAGLEAGLTDTIDAARTDGVVVCEAIDGVKTLPASAAAAGHERDGHSQERREQDRHEQDRHGEVNPHFFTDAARMALAVQYLTSCITAALDGERSATMDAMEQSANSYHDELMALDRSIRTILDAVPPERRQLVTTHEVLDYFADRYGFTIAGSIIASTSSQAQADAASMVELAGIVRDQDIPAVFVDASSSKDLARTLAEEAGGIAVVELHTESLGSGDAATYIGMSEQNAQQIAEALA